MRSLLLLLPLTLACEGRVERVVERNNSCEVDADCALIFSKCPYGCYQAVEVDQADRVESLIDRMPSACAYDCIAASGAVCDAGTCAVAYEDTGM